jgi:uncharacterized protein DUF4157
MKTYHRAPLRNAPEKRIAQPDESRAGVSAARPQNLAQPLIHDFSRISFDAIPGRRAGLRSGVSPLLSGRKDDASGSFQFGSAGTTAPVERQVATADATAAPQSPPGQAAHSRGDASGGGVPSRRPNSTGLPDRLKARLEHMSGFCMDDVRVHFRSPAPSRLRALAFTEGTHIHVGPGEEKHLPHEAWHVVQQKEGRVRPTMVLNGVAANLDPNLERDAQQFSSSYAAIGTSHMGHRGGLGSKGRPVKQFTYGDLQKAKNWWERFDTSYKDASNYVGSKINRLLKTYTGNANNQNPLEQRLPDEEGEYASQGLEHNAHELMTKGGGYLYQSRLQANFEKEGHQTKSGFSNKEHPDFTMRKDDGPSVVVEAKTTAKTDYLAALKGAVAQIAKRHSTHGLISIQVSDFELGVQINKEGKKEVDAQTKIYLNDQKIPQSFGYEQIQVEFRDFRMTRIYLASYFFKKGKIDQAEIKVAEGYGQSQPKMDTTT